MKSHCQAKREKKKETVGDKDYELEGSDDDDDDGGGSGDDMTELMDVGLAYLEDEKKREETEDEKLDITTGGDEATENDYEEGD